MACVRGAACDGRRFDCCSRSGNDGNQNVTSQVTKPPEDPADDHSEEESDEEEEFDTAPTTLTPGNLKELNEEKDNVNKKLLEVKESIREFRKSKDKAALAKAKEDEADLKCQCMNLDRRIEAINQHSKNRPEAGAVYEYTWEDRGTLGLRLQDTKEFGVLVSFVAKDANYDMPDLTGYTVTHVHGESAEGKSVNEVVQMIQGSDWPLKMTFKEGMKTTIDADGDGQIDEDEMHAYMAAHGSSPEMPE